MRGIQKQILVSAGDAITAKLVKEAGFDGIWISGFEASARLGIADNGSITMTEMLNIAKPIVNAVDLPVYVDVDTGYGNFARTVREFEKIGVFGICVEDNIEPKINSLWGERIPIMSKEQFGDKIKVRRDKIKIIARTEALIRGYDNEAFGRLLHYKDCGVDILLPHTRNYEKIMTFTKELIKDWGISFAIVPTKFPWITNQQLFQAGYSMIIWANQTERVKIKATRQALECLKAFDCAKYIENNLSSTLEDMKGLMPDV